MAGLLLTGGAVRAELALCNGSAAPIRLAGVAPEYEGGLSVRGLGDLEPGLCATLDFRPVLTPPYYYRVEAPAFSGDDRAFCVEDAAHFYLEAVESCPADSHPAGFRLLQPPPGAGLMVVNLGAGGELLPDPDLPVIDLRQPFVPAAPPAAAPPPASGPPSGPPPLDGWLGPRLIAGGIAPGSLGESYAFDGLWEGCGAGTDPVCTFHAQGWRFQAAAATEAAAGTPHAFLDRLRTLARGTAVTVTADLLARQPDRAEVAISQVQVVPDSPFLGLFWALQGRWQPLDEGKNELDIDGSLMVEFRQGAEQQRAYLLLQAGCGDPAAAADSGEPPALALFSVPDYDRNCLVLEALTRDELVLFSPDQGERRRYRRP